MNLKDGEKPGYILALEAVYGSPSQAAFGSAVFFDSVQASEDLEKAARKYYRHFIGSKWNEWGEDVCMTPWQEVYVRKPDGGHDVVKELRNIDDITVSMSVPMLLEGVDNVETAVQVLATAYNSPEVTDFRVYTIGDGEAMSGLLLAGRREDCKAIFLVFLMD